MISIIEKLIVAVVGWSFLAGWVMAEEVTFYTQKISINHQKLLVEVASTDEQRQQGLMHRVSLADGRGMLFDLGGEAVPCFWMKNTSIALSLAFVDVDYKITQIEPLVPNDVSYVCSKVAIRYAIEVPWGWFARQGIEVGMRVEGIKHPMLE